MRGTAHWAVADSVTVQRKEVMKNGAQADPTGQQLFNAEFL
jgi:hypothetical protein